MLMLILAEFLYVSSVLCASGAEGSSSSSHGRRSWEEACQPLTEYDSESSGMPRTLSGDCFPEAIYEPLSSSSSSTVPPSSLVLSVPLHQLLSPHANCLYRQTLSDLPASLILCIRLGHIRRSGWSRVYRQVKSLSFPV